MRPDTKAAAEHARHFQPHWVSRAAFPLVATVLALVELGLFFAVTRGIYWLAVPLVLVASHLMHGSLIAFHEASHGLLRKNRTWNEMDGIVIGLLSLTSFSLYRAAHQTHHAHLGTVRDEEFWPFTDTKCPRWFRVLAAFLELFLGLIYSPLLFVRSFLRPGSPVRSKKVRWRIWMEFALLAVVWGTMLAVVAWLGAWKYLIWLYVLPAFIAGNLQSWRKHIEHVGLTGTTVKGTTRSVVADDWWGRLVALTLLHEPYHGVHHQRVGVPHAHLPGYVAELEPASEEELAPFPSYTHAFRHLIRSLVDPKVGPQWREGRMREEVRGER
jgi:fatty acid desaturase